ncbi:MAG: 1,4-alpha-glucan branching protein GlgB [Polyangiaceae bacterium]|nr:1,4-alpha-glucan branching protein GlgB [Polyangiaceae bacterium]
MTSDALGGPDELRERLLRGELHDPHALLGAHPFGAGATVRAFHPEAERAECLLGTRALEMQAIGGGLFAIALPSERVPLGHRVRFHFAGGGMLERDDPYRFLPTVGELDLHLFAEGNHRRLWQVLGANVRVVDGVEGTAFAVWAPTARAVSLIGDFDHWDPRALPMRALGASGVWELFVPGVGVGSQYKFVIRSNLGVVRVKSDPYAKAMELPPQTASVVTRQTHEWGDAEWMASRRERDWRREPMSIYELHFGSWRRILEEGNRSLSYRELAAPLVEHLHKLGMTHVELMPMAEHPFYGSWGYQISGYFAPTARFGVPDDFRYFVDVLHQNGIGVLLDWVPAHFPKDDFALARFDGSALYEHQDPRLGEHPDWGTLIFNYGRAEVRAFLLANALYWLEEFHIDGLRVDAVASMLYLDYSRNAGEWVPNRFGGRENLEAIELLKAVNHIVTEEAPGAITIAEESTAWAGVTTAAVEGGLGFTFKWNMGWMHDTLSYFQKEPIYRKFHQNQLTFSMIYEYHERFINSLSHDEVVHGKGALLSKMPGDDWQRFANLRALFAYQYTRPGKQLYFMGAEIAQRSEWNHDGAVDFGLLADERHARHLHFMQALGQLYLRTPALWRDDPSPESFEWIDAADSESSVFSYLRRSGDEVALVIMNLTPVPRRPYRVGAPRGGEYRVVLDTDAVEFGGSGFSRQSVVQAQAEPVHGRPCSIELDLPPLAALVLVPS